MFESQDNSGEINEELILEDRADDRMDGPETQSSHAHKVIAPDEEDDDF